MSLPNEKYRAINYAREFMRSLLDPKKTPRVPRAVRSEAYYRLKHFPAEYEMEEVRVRCPRIFGKVEE